MQQSIHITPTICISDSHCRLQITSANILVYYSPSPLHQHTVYTSLSLASDTSVSKVQNFWSYFPNLLKVFFLILAEEKFNIRESQNIVNKIDKAQD